VAVQIAIDKHTFESREHERQTMDIKSLIIGVLAVAVVILGYMVYDANRTKVKIDLPGVKIEGR
jgi:hypothetical protein